jgi:hypothetical protein
VEPNNFWERWSQTTFGKSCAKLKNKNAKYGFFIFYLLIIEVGFVLFILKTQKDLSLNSS